MRYVHTFQFSWARGFFSSYMTHMCGKTPCAWATFVQNEHDTQVIVHTFRYSLGTVCVVSCMTHMCGKTPCVHGMKQITVNEWLC